MRKMGITSSECGSKKNVEINEYYLDSIAHDFLEKMENNMTYVLSDGEETGCILNKIGITFKKGVQVIKNGKFLYTGLNPEDLENIDLDENTKFVFCPEEDGTIFQDFNILKKFNKKNIDLLITPTRLESMKGNPFIIKTGDESLNKQLSGYYKVTTSNKRVAIYNARIDDEMKAKSDIC